VKEGFWISKDGIDLKTKKIQKSKKTHMTRTFERERRREVEYVII
jgi:hypothetical protein